MTPQDFKEASKKHLIQAALEVLANVVQNGKCEDSNLDVTRSSSLPTLLISIVRNVTKSDVKVPDLLVDLLENISLLCKNSFNKQVGIEPIYMKGFIPLLPTLIREKDETLKLATLKALGTFATLAAIIPIRMQAFFKDILENGMVRDVCEIIKSIQANNITPIHLVAMQNLSTLICPVYGDFYSFPWKRGPHDSILEYIEVQGQFETLRSKIFFELKGQDLLSKTMLLFMSEEKQQHLEVRCCCLRFLNQLLHSFNSKLPQGERAIEIFIQDKSSVSLISQIAFQAQDQIIQSTALQIMA